MMRARIGSRVASSRGISVCLKRTSPSSRSSIRNWTADGGHQRGWQTTHRSLISSMRSYSSSQSTSLSDKLLGHSPMAPATPTSVNHAFASIPTAKDVTTSGGVWAPTSAKRDKITELQGALGEDKNHRTLDDLATPEQLYDLWLCDGVAAVVSTADAQRVDVASSSEPQQQHEEECNSDDNDMVQIVKELDAWWEKKVPEGSSQGLAQIQFENILQDYAKAVEQRLSTIPPETCLRDVRDFFDVSSINSRNPTYDLPIPKQDDPIYQQQPANHIFDKAVLRYRLELARAAAQTLQTSWTTLTKVSDSDIDRAAVDGIDSNSLKVSSIPADKIHAVLNSFLHGSAQDRVDTLWNLIDRDGDERLEESEMNTVSDLAVAPVQTALERLWTDALEASLVRPSPDVLNSNKDEPPPKVLVESLSWNEKRKEKREKKRLLKTLQKTLKRHFVDEVEQSHRLRCIYAWANKAHQDNSIKSVLVENDESWGGLRKRYVELVPKISLDEFREVQQEHFSHLDRVGAEFCKSLREDVWILQGNGRLSRELWRDCAIFMTVVCTVDYIIIVL